MTTARRFQRTGGPFFLRPRSALSPSVVPSMGLNGHVFTQKELRLIAQGCPRMRATLGERAPCPTTLKGLRPSRNTDDGTPLGYIVRLNLVPRVARFARNRWAVGRNSFGVKANPKSANLELLTFAKSWGHSLRGNRSSVDESQLPRYSRDRYDLLDARKELP